MTCLTGWKLPFLADNFNLHYDLYKLHVRQVCTVLCDGSFMQLVREPVHGHEHAVIWLVALEGSALIHDIAVSETAFSDHLTLSFSLNLK